jgi:hypothetical protein
VRQTGFSQSRTFKSSIEVEFTFIVLRRKSGRGGTRPWPPRPHDVVVYA